MTGLVDVNSTNNALALTFEAHDVRVMLRDGEPWFVLADVCAVLEHSNPSMAAKVLDDDERGALSIADPMGRMQDTTIISEPGLYKLVQTSRKPQAKRFDRWVRHDVLPDVRRTGSYGALAPVDPTVTHNDLIASMREIAAAIATRFDGQDRAIERFGSRLDTAVSDISFLKCALFRGRRNLIEATKRQHVEDTGDLGGRCPCCGTANVVENGTKSLFADFDHFYQSSHPNPEHTWLICRPCHSDLTTGRVPRDQRRSEFDAYQARRRRLPGRQPRLI